MQRLIDKLEGPGAWDDMDHNNREEHVTKFAAVWSELFGGDGFPYREYVDACAYAMGMEPGELRTLSRTRYYLTRRKVVEYSLMSHITPTPSVHDAARAAGRTNRDSAYKSLKWGKARLEAGDEEVRRLASVCERAIKKIEASKRRECAA